MRRSSLFTAARAALLGLAALTPAVAQSLPWKTPSLRRVPREALSMSTMVIFSMPLSTLGFGRYTASTSSRTASASMVQSPSIRIG